MGSENTIRTGTVNGNNRNRSFSNSNNISNVAPSSIYQFGIVTAINLTTKEIVYNAIEDNVASQKLGKALPLYKNKIQLPTTGSIVPLLRGPNTDVSVIGGQYSKIVYYMDPIGIWQTVEKNIVERTADISPAPKDVNVSNIDILTKTATETVATGFSGNIPTKGSYMCVGDLLINFNKTNNSTVSSRRLVFAHLYANTPYSVIATNYDSNLPAYSFDVSGISFSTTTTLENVQFIAIGPRPTILY